MSFTFNSIMPDISSKDAARAYSIGNYYAQLLVAPPMAAATIKANLDKNKLIRYLYAMVVYDDKDIRMIITLETSSNKIISLSPAGLKEQLKYPFLCIFNEDGSHDIIEQYADCSNIELFCDKCFELIVERYGETSTPLLVNKSTYTTPNFKLFRHANKPRQVDVAMDNHITNIKGHPD